MCVDKQTKTARMEQRVREGDDEQQKKPTEYIVTKTKNEQSFVYINRWSQWINIFALMFSETHTCRRDKYTSGKSTRSTMSERFQCAPIA